MTDKKDKTKGLGRKDIELWKAMTGDVKRLKGREYTQGHEQEEETPAPVYERVSIPKEKPRELPKGGAHGLDRRTELRLERGQMEIEGKLDLHGMSQAQAQKALETFIKRGYESGKRCVLVITGKGRRDKEGLELEPGILKKKVPEWLDTRPIKPFILKYHPAKPKHGGSGALYVLLRRQRNT